MKSLGASELAQWFSLFMYRGQVPRCINDARVVLIPKVAKPESPSDFRPISVSSVVSRLFHKVLEKRLGTIGTNPQQKGFRPVDGCRDHTWTLQALLKRARSEMRPLYLCFVDVKNAFGAMTHEELIKTVRSRGYRRLCSGTLSACIPTHT